MRTFWLFLLFVSLGAVLWLGSVEAQPQPAAPADEEGGADKNRPEVQWQDSWQSAFGASEKSHKPIFVFIYLPRDKACVSVFTKTLTDGDVVKALGDFECCALNIRDRNSKAFLDAYGARAAKGQQLPTAPANTLRGRTELALTPAFLFLGPDRAEYYRQVGYVPGPVFEAQVRRAQALISAFQLLQRDAKSAVAMEAVGRAYLDLELYEPGRAYIKQAIEADPANATGACAEAKLDLAILRIREDPAKALDELIGYATANPTSARLLEVRYYMAVAQIAAGNTRQAEKLLVELVPKGREDPIARSEWSVRAIELLGQLQKANG